MKRFVIFHGVRWIDPETGEDRGYSREYTAIYDRFQVRYALFGLRSPDVHYWADDLNKDHERAEGFSWQDEKEVA